MLIAEDIDARMAMLKNLPLSQGVSDDQLFMISQYTTTIYLKEGESPLHIEMGDEQFFIVASGKIRATFLRSHRSAYTSILRPGDFLGAEKLLFGQTSLDSTVAIEPTVLLSIGTNQLAEILRNTPQLRDNLKERAKIYRLRQNKHFSWLTETERVELITRKHPIVLLISFFRPLGLGWLGVLFLWLATLTQDSALSTTSNWLGNGLMGFAFLWALERFLIWSIDFYIVTDQRVVWQEQVLGLYDSRIEIPMAMVMPPKLMQGRYERILGFGDVFAMTDRTPIDYQVYIHIDLLDIPFPERIQGHIEHYRQQANLRANTDEDASIESVLSQYLEQKPRGERPSITLPSTEATSKKKLPVSLRLSDTFKTRLEDGKTITYRKHWIVLFRKVWLPTLLSLIVLGLLAFLLQQRVTNQIGYPSILTIICAGFIFYTIPVLWWIYQVLDWRNDIYQLAEDKLLDIERKPFIGQVISKPFLLSKIRSLDFDRVGFLERLRNSGCIFIGTVDDKLVFNGVHEPDRIMREIYARIYSIRQKSKATAMRNNQESAAKIVVAYHRRSTRGRKLGESPTAQKS